MKSTAYLFVIALISLTVTACGSIATPVPLVTNTPTSVADAMTAQAVAAVATSTPTPTDTPVPPTDTPAPPTNTPIPPTDTPVPVASDPVSVLVSLADPARGEVLFNTEYETAAGPYRCITCHLVDSEQSLIGPGLLNLADRAGDRVPGESAALYTLNSIIHPNDYIVEGYAPGIMPLNYRDIFTDSDLYDLVAYMLSLRD